MMTLFHGSYASVSQPQASHGRRNLDFGRGFYLTSLRPQAERWAQLVTERKMRNGIPQLIVHRQTPQRVEEIFIGFIRLLPRYFVEHHDILFYADQLHISTVYLSRVVRQATGRTVIDYINQMLLMEAAFLLQTTQLSISQIADRLHFADTPSFSKFFLRHNGMSPKEYRKG